MIVSPFHSGYLVFRITLNGGTPLVKQLKWFESRQKHILGVTFDPLGEWLACACLDGSLCLIPVYSLLTVSISNQYKICRISNSCT